MTVVTLSETYDLSTKVNKMSMVGIHTPSANLIRKTYPGLVMNNRMCKILSCDVKLACASVLPADPLQVGVSAGKVAPQDMFNPILYKAVSNQGMSNFELRMQSMTGGGTPAISGESVDALDQDINVEAGHNTDDFGLYYNLLANHRGFKIAHPQAGLRMSNLRPFVYERYYNVGDNDNMTTENANDGLYVLGGSSYVDSSNAVGRHKDSVQTMIGKRHSMPAFNTLYLSENSGAGPGLIGGEYITQKETPKIMPIYVGLILLPPCKLNVLYYRLVVRWKVALFGIRPVQEIESFRHLESTVGTFYATDYANASKSMEEFTDMVDTKDADIEKIMEGA